MTYCSLQHQTLLPSPVTFTTGHCFHFGSIPSFFLELFLHWSPVAYWAPTELGSSSFSILSFCLFILFMGFSRQEYWSGLSFPSPVDHILSELSTMTHLSWVALHGIAHSFIELDKVWPMWSLRCMFCKLELDMKNLTGSKIHSHYHRDFQYDIIQWNTRLIHMQLPIFNQFWHPKIAILYG